MVANPEVFVSISLSILGCSFTILTYLLFPDLRTNSRTFACWLAVGGLGYSSTVFFQSRDKTQGLACMIEAFVESYFALVCLFTTVIYSVTISNLFASLNSNHVEKLSITVKPIHFFFVWILTFFIALLPYTTGSYGRNRSDLYCWIKTDTHNDDINIAGYLWEIFVLYFWVVLAIAYNGYIYSTVVRRIHLWKGDEPHIVRTKAVVNRMMLYPLILAAVYTAPLLHRLLEFFGVKPFWLIRTAVFTLKLQGFLDAIAYGLSPAIVARWKLVLEGMHTFITTGKFIPISELVTLKSSEDNDAGATPPMFSQYRINSNSDHRVNSGQSDFHSEGDDIEMTDPDKQHDDDRNNETEHETRTREEALSKEAITGFFNADNMDFDY